jgi:hypothetical protein
MNRAGYDSSFSKRIESLREGDEVFSTQLLTHSLEGKCASSLESST